MKKPSRHHDTAVQHLMLTALDSKLQRAREQDLARACYENQYMPIFRIAEILDHPIPAIERMVLRSMDASCAQFSHARCMGRYYDERRRIDRPCECECHR